MRIPSLVLGEYSDLRSQDFNYGNDGCDGFAPNFPLIRAKRNQAAKLFNYGITHHYAEVLYHKSLILSMDLKKWNNSI